MRRGQAIVDTTTFKRGVIPHYRGYPSCCLVSSVHPLFGPGAGKEKLGKLVVLVVPVPGREQDSVVIEDFFKGLGFKTRIIDCDAHDEAVASMIDLSYVLGLAAALYVEELGLEEWEELSGTTFRLLLVHARSILESSDGFISYIVTDDLVRHKTALYMEKLRLIEALGEAPPNVLAKLRNRLGGATRIRRAYEAMYRALEHEEGL